MVIQRESNEFAVEVRHSRTGWRSPETTTLGRLWRGENRPSQTPPGWLALPGGGVDTHQLEAFDDGARVQRAGLPVEVVHALVRHVLDEHLRLLQIHQDPAGRGL